METVAFRPKRDRRAQLRIPSADVAARAYELYCQRGREHGYDVEDWLQAERELRARSHAWVYERGERSFSYVPATDGNVRTEYDKAS
jgi:hypothetical protein